MPMLKKLLLSILILIQLFGFSLAAATTTKAQEWYNQDFNQWSEKVFNSPESEIFGERYTFAQVTWIIHSLTAIVMGDTLSSCLSSSSIENLRECLQKISNEPLRNSPSSYKPSPILGLASITDSLINTRPSSGIQYITEAASNLHIIPEAHAQGVGYQTLRPIQTLWAVSRNIAYLLAIIATIAVAFMIMFRVKISPQAVVTIQSAIPKLAIALILITFSYAIAGFIIDLAYIITGLIALLVKSSNPSDAISSLSMTSLFTRLSGGSSSLAPDAVFSVFLGLIIGGIIGFVGGLIVGIPAIFFTGGTGLTLTLGSITLFIFAAIAIIFLIRLIWLLLRTLTIIILLVIAGPVMILLNVFPNSNGFSRWLRNLIANVAVFPVVAILLLISHFFYFQLFLGGLDVEVSGTDVGEAIARIMSSIPNEVNNFNTFNIKYQNITGGVIGLPGFGGSIAILGFFLSFAVIGLIPNTGNLIRSLIEGKPFDIETAIRESLGAPARGGTAAAINKYEAGLGHESGLGASLRSMGWIGGRR